MPHSSPEDGLGGMVPSVSSLLQSYPAELNLGDDKTSQ